MQLKVRLCRIKLNWTEERDSKKIKTLKDIELSRMTSEGRASLLVVVKSVTALLAGDDGAQLALLADEIILDYSGKFGYGTNTLKKADAIRFHKELRDRIELVDYNLYTAYGDGNSVLILGDRTEKIKETGAVTFEKCIWIYTVADNLIEKIQYLCETHPAFSFFGNLIDRSSR